MPPKYIPRPYQDLIINHETETLRGNIWAGMGMGKTVATLTALEDLFMAGAETCPALVLAPLRVAASTWPDEALKWGHLRNIEVQPIIGNAKARSMALTNSNASVFTINYDNLVWLVEELGERWPFGTVIPDESTRLKSFRLRGGGKRAAALGKVAHKYVRRWINLTGTPAPNGLVDLWGQSWFVDQGQRLGRTYGAFTSRWFNSIQFPGQSWTKQNAVRSQSQDAPSLRSCFRIIPPCSSVHAQACFRNSSRLRSVFFIPCPASLFTTLASVAMEAWSVPGTQQAFLPSMRARRTNIS